MQEVADKAFKPGDRVRHLFKSSDVIFHHEGEIGDDLWKWLFSNDPEMRDWKSEWIEGDTLETHWTVTFDEQAGP